MPKIAVLYMNRSTPLVHCEEKYMTKKESDVLYCDDPTQVSKVLTAI